MKTIVSIGIAAIMAGLLGCSTPADKRTATNPNPPPGTPGVVANPGATPPPGTPRTTLMPPGSNYDTGNQTGQ